MNIATARAAGEAKAAEFNPTGIVPFPFADVLKKHTDLRILLVPELPENVSGAIGFSKTDDSFSILINSNKPQSRKYFTTAHELGHFFLHRAEIVEKTVLIDPDNTLDISGMIFRADDAPITALEQQANNFAGSLLMPEKRVREVWQKLKDIEQCAAVFGVSVVAMSVRLQILKLVG